MTKIATKTVAGFTLVELMIAVAIIAILANFAYPSYQQHMRKTKRVDGQTALMEMMSRQERYYTEYNSYTTTLSKLGYSSASDVLSQEGHYKISASACSSGLSACVKLTAAAQGSQVADGDLTIDSNNQRSGHW